MADADQTPSMRRYIALFVGGAAFIAAACSEPVAPPAAPAVTVALPSVVSAPIAFNVAAFTQAPSYSFTLSPNGGRVKIGKYTLTYDANAVCDPSTSSYGPSEWEKPCATLNTSITITAKFWTEDGRTYADFSPDIRFDPSKVVTLTSRVPALRGTYITDDVRAAYSVGYTKVVDGMRYFIDESSDPKLATVFGQSWGVANGWVSRRVLHFSGYYVRSGRVCDETTGECTDGTVDQLTTTTTNTSLSIQ